MLILRPRLILNPITITTNLLYLSLFKFANGHKSSKKPKAQNQDSLGHCTSMGWTQGSTKEHVGIAAQTDDGEGLGDYRLVKVPEMKHSINSDSGNFNNNFKLSDKFLKNPLSETVEEHQIRILNQQFGDQEPISNNNDVNNHLKSETAPVQRAVYGDNSNISPVYRLVVSDRGPDYAPSSSTIPTPYQPIGYIPQTKKTFAYYDGDYGLQSDYISIGESTCSAKLYAYPVNSPHLYKDSDSAIKGTALLTIEELSRIALERCKSASCAVDTMGALGELYGFWSTQDVADSGESLFISDGRETWIFHILADVTGKSAIWASQRVPDGHMAVVSNMFIIREMKLNDYAMFRASHDIVGIAEKLGWYDPKSNLPFDFVKAFSSGEYAHPYYSARRAWRIMSRVAPSLNLDPYIGYDLLNPTYPVTVKPDRLWSMNEIFTLYRDHYEGTPFDLTKGLTAGMYSNPSRWAGVTSAESGSELKDLNKYGAWERSISIYRTNYAHIAASKAPTNTSDPEKTVNVLWWSPGRPSAGIFVPIQMPKKTKKNGVPMDLKRGTMLKAEREHSLFWATNAIANWADNKYEQAHVEIRKLQSAIESKLVAEIYSQSDSSNRSDDSESYFTSLVTDSIAKMWDFFYDVLMPKFQNGYILDLDKQIANEAGYSIDYLEKTKDFGNFNGGFDVKTRVGRENRGKFDLMRKRMKDFQKIADEIAGRRSVKGSSSENRVKAEKKNENESEVINDIKNVYV